MGWNNYRKRMFAEKWTRRAAGVFLLIVSLVLLVGAVIAGVAFGVMVFQAVLPATSFRVAAMLGLAGGLAICVAGMTGRWWAVSRAAEFLLEVR